MPVHANFVDTLEQVGDLALGKVGEKKRLTNIETDTGNHAEVIRLFIHQVIREVQSEFRWSELTKSVELESPIAENDDTYQYTLPSDFLRPASNRDQDYVIENGYLFTSVAENFPFRYIRYSENPAEWSGLMVKCVFFRLALEICMPLTENAQKYNSLLEEYEKVVFPRAKMVGSFDTENPRPRIARGRYSRTRGGVGGAIAGAFNRVIGVIAPGHNHDVDYVSLHGTDQVAEENLQSGSVTAVKLAGDATALITDGDAATLASAESYADAADVVALASAASTADSKDAAVRVALLPNIVYAKKTTVETITGANPGPNWTNIADMVATITPRLATSKLRIRAVIYGQATSSSYPIVLRITRDAAAIELATDKGTNRTACHGLIGYFYEAHEMGCSVIELIVEATDASATVFRVQAGILSNSTNTGMINRSQTDTDTTLFPRCISTLTVEEIFTA
jgi:hypothetical protein